jgi:hypothetical protein
MVSEFRKILCGMAHPGWMGKLQGERERERGGIWGGRDKVEERGGDMEGRWGREMEGRGEGERGRRERNIWRGEERERDRGRESKRGEIEREWL